MKDTQLYAQILGIVSPWSVDSVDLDIKGEKVTVQVSFNEGHHFTCPLCSKESSRYDKVRRQWRHLDTCQLQTTIEADVPRVDCQEHGVHQVLVPWSKSGSRNTMLFECLVLRWLQETTISAVSQQMHLDWDTVHGIQRRAVERGLERRKALTPTNITIDETSEKKGHNYLTVVSEGSRVLYIAEDHELASIDGFWKTLSTQALEGIRSVSVDLWKAYTSSTLAQEQQFEDGRGLLGG